MRWGKVMCEFLPAFFRTYSAAAVVVPAAAVVVAADLVVPAAAVVVAAAVYTSVRVHACAAGEEEFAEFAVCA